jgi:transcriptional regulator with XRE-family HTH domain
MTEVARGTLLRLARERRRMTQSRAAQELGIRQSRLSALESDANKVRWPLIERAAALYRMPLQWFTTATLRPGEEIADTAVELLHHGLDDLLVPGARAPGAFRRFEELVAVVISGTPHPRIITAMPALILLNRGSAQLMLAFAGERDVVHRLGWLCDIALTLLDRGVPSPGAVADVATLRSVIVEPPPPPRTSFDSLGSPAEKEDQLPAIWRRWKVSFDEPIETFAERARYLLGRVR